MNHNYLISLFLTGLVIAVVVSGCKINDDGATNATSNNPTSELPTISNTGTNTPSVTPTTTGITLEESIAQGRTVIEAADFTEAEKARVNELAAKVPEDIRKQFEELYTAWEYTVSEAYLAEDPIAKYQSNPGFWTHMDEYKQLTAFLQEQGKSVWPLLFQKIAQEKANTNLRGLKAYMLDVMLTGLTMKDYTDTLDQARANYHRYNDKGQYVIPDQGAVLINYIQGLLDLY